MGSKHRRYLLGVVSITLVLSACTNGGGAGKTAPPPNERPSSEMLVLDTTAGVKAIDTATGSVLFERTGVSAMPDWSRLFTATPAGGATQLREIDPRTGGATASISIDGRFAVQAVSADGGAIALSPPAPGKTDAWTPVDRSSTTIVVAHPGASGTGAASERFRLRGNFVPEAFSTDDQNLFMIEYLPAIDPVAYRVVRLWLDKGKVEPLVGRTKASPAPERMAGTRLQQVRAPDGSQLLTLYTNQPAEYAKEYSSHPYEGGRPVAFIHTLNLQDGWAYCLDLPRAFGPGPESSKAIALSPDGSRLYAVDTARGLVAVMDTQRLKVVSTEHVAFSLDGGGQTVANVGSDGRTLFVARGSQLVAIDTTSFATIDRWPLPTPATGLASSTDGTRLYATTSNDLRVLDPATGQEMRSYPISGVNGIDYIGVPPVG